MIDDYFVWLRERTSLRQNTDNDIIEIFTPYTDRHNDYISIYVMQKNGGYVLTDAGYTIQDLELCGCNLSSKKRQEILELTLNGFGVKKDAQNKLFVSTNKQNFSLQKHNLLQAILAVNDMFYLSSPYVASLFVEDVTNWLDSNDIRYTPGVKITGKSGYDHYFNFIIPKSREKPERMIRVINRPNRDSATRTITAWTDTKDVRKIDSTLYAFLNDVLSEIPETFIEALKAYQIRPARWSEREKVKEELAA